MKAHSRMTSCFQSIQKRCAPRTAHLELPVGPSVADKGIHEKLGSTGAWAREFGFNHITTLRRLLQITRSTRGKLFPSNKEISLYAESDVRVAVERFSSLPQADENGYFEISGDAYATIGAYARKKNMNYTSVKNRCSRFAGIDGRSPTGQILLGKFFRESDLEAACAGLTSGKNAK